MVNEKTTEQIINEQINERTSAGQPREADPRTRRNALFALEDDDLEFVLRFVLSSGSLKEMATQYKVSYPTLRAKLDRLIARLEQITAGKQADPMADLLAEMIERGEISVSTARGIRDLYRRQMQKKDE